MKIVEVSGCKYQVVLEHPDYGCERHEFIVDDDNVPSPFADDSSWVEYNNRVCKEVWKKFNGTGFYHTMTITSEHVIEDKVYHATVCEEFGHGDYLNIVNM